MKQTFRWISMLILSVSAVANAQSREEVLRKISELQSKVSQSRDLNFAQIQELDFLLEDALSLLDQGQMIHCSDQVNFTRDPANAFSFNARRFGRQNSDGCLYFTTARYNNPVVLRATYTFNNLRTGNYKVGLSWVFGDPNRASRIPVDIYDGFTLVTSTFINQQPVNAGLTMNGLVFTEVASVPVTSGQLRVVVRNDVDAENNGKYIDFHSAVALPERVIRHLGQ